MSLSNFTKQVTVNDVTYTYIDINGDDELIFPIEMNYIDDGTPVFITMIFRTDMDELVAVQDHDYSGLDVAPTTFGEMMLAYIKNGRPIYNKFIGDFILKDDFVNIKSKTSGNTSGGGSSKTYFADDGIVLTDDTFKLSQDTKESLGKADNAIPKPQGWGQGDGTKFLSDDGTTKEIQLDALTDDSVETRHLQDESVTLNKLASEVIDAMGSDGGFLPPSMDEVTRDSMTAEEGAIIFNTDTKTHQGFDGTSWNDLYQVG